LPFKDLHESILFQVGKKKKKKKRERKRERGISLPKGIQNILCNSKTNIQRKHFLQLFCLSYPLSLKKERFRVITHTSYGTT
jgi:hypothetical protein